MIDFSKSKQMSISCQSIKKINIHAHSSTLNKFYFKYTTDVELCTIMDRRIKYWVNMFLPPRRVLVLPSVKKKV